MKKAQHPTSTFSFQQKVHDQQHVIDTLSRQLAQKDAEIAELQDNISNILHSFRWKMIDRVVTMSYKVGFHHIKHAIKKLRKQTAHPTKKNTTRQVINPYHALELLKPISVRVVHKNYEKIHIKTKFSSATTIYQEGKNILLFLKSIEDQSLQPNEVVLVDGGSTDKTLFFVKQFMKKSTLHIRLFSGKRLNIPQGRNCAIKKARYEIVALADAGTVLDKNYFKNLIGCFEEHPHADLVGGIFLPCTQSQNTNQHIPVWESLDWKNYLPSTRCMVLKKSLWEKSGKYPEYLQTGDDTLFDINYRRLSKEWVFNTSASVFWEAPVTLEQSKKLAENYGKGDGESGVGDFSFYSYLAFHNKNLPIPDPLSRMNFFHGYIKGRERRAEIDITIRKITGLVLILGTYYINDSRERKTLRLVQEYIKNNYKIVYVNLFPSDNGFFTKKWINIDYSLLELYHMNDFSFQELIERYRQIHSALQILRCSSHASYSSVFQEIEKYQNKHRFPRNS